MSSLEPGLHHAGYDGWWFMVGRALPALFAWRSLPPAGSLSLVWGAGGCTVTDARGTVMVRHGELLFLGAEWPHEGLGHAGSDFLTVFRWGARGAGRNVVSSSPDTFAAGVRAAEAAQAGRAAAPADAATLEVAIHAGGAPADGAPTNLRRAKALLDERFRDPVDLNTLSDRAGLSPSELVRQFKSAFGITPIQYRKQRRLLDATARLRAGGSVTAAALEAGFADGAHLTRTFRAQYGASPSAWLHAVGSESTRCGGATPLGPPPRAPGTGPGRVG